MDGGNISGATSATLSINPVNLSDASSNYNVVITGACSPNASALSVSLVVSTAPIIITQPANQMACEASEVSFSVAATGSGLSYQWRKGTVNLTNGANISGATSDMFTINHMDESDVASNYNVVITGFCSPVVTSSNASLSLCSLTEIATMDPGTINNTISIYPNPFSTSLNIIINDTTQISRVKLSICDILGAEVIKKTLTKKSTTLGTSNLPSGIYFYKVIDNNKIIQSGKLISHQ
jgi:hypothetical protein